MNHALQTVAEQKLADIEHAGLLRHERILGGAQGRYVQLADGRRVLNFCANNYLGLAADSRVVAAARDSYESWGFGLASVRFICGTQQVHADLEQELATFLGTEAAILYSSCYDANAGLFETLLGPDDVVISDALNHASIIDGIRLCKAKRLRYANRDMDDLRAQLAKCRDARLRLIATDGVFSMDGTIAPLDRICELADEYAAAVMVDDSHATGFVGQRGRGTPEYFGVGDRVDVMTGTFGKALGGASGGYTAGRDAIIELLRQCSRPYLFSNSLAPAVVQTTRTVLKLIDHSDELRQRLWRNVEAFRHAMSDADFSVPSTAHPIVPVMIGDASTAQRMASKLLEHGIYAIAFSYPVVPRDQARIRLQISAAHELEDIDKAVSAFVHVRHACRN